MANYNVITEETMKNIKTVGKYCYLATLSGDKKAAAKARLRAFATKVIEEDNAQEQPKAEPKVESKTRGLIKGEIREEGDILMGTLVYRGLVINFVWGVDQDGERYAYPWFKTSRPLLDRNTNQKIDLLDSNSPATRKARGWVRAAIKAVASNNGINL